MSPSLRGEALVGSIPTQGAVHHRRKAQRSLRLLGLRMLAESRKPLLTQILCKHVRRRHLEQHRHGRPYDREMRLRAAVLQLMPQTPEDALMKRPLGGAQKKLSRSSTALAPQAAGRSKPRPWRSAHAHHWPQPTSMPPEAWAPAQTATSPRQRPASRR